eukprot:CAMPEP_0196666766 /NCGR_PEP_ID=MMETSP1086-20130531/64702_1 /TAXON_ID=77921 /ORGANISM="Cyanoptyche  gloeocystis , Strain SAG4.97" /LENGTH=39 /DNA_ID= /DNA_START= /DNA_END= /DNA_ORIENTATION=
MLLERPSAFTSTELRHKLLGGEVAGGDDEQSTRAEHTKQ